MAGRAGSRLGRRGHGPQAILACPPGEMHNLALMIFGIALNRAGWRIEHFRADAPVGELAHAVHARRLDLVVQAERAKAICARCPVRQRCLAFAPDTRQDYGIWGGCDEDERQILHRRWRRGT